MRQGVLFLAVLMAAAWLAAPLAAAKDTVKTDLPLSRDGVIRVNLINGSLDITGRDGEGVSMYAEVKGGLETFVYESDGRTARFEQDPPRFARNWDGDVELTLQGPAGVRLDVEGVNMGVNAAKLTGLVEIELVNGDIVVKPGTASAHVETVNGKIELSGVKDGVSVQTVNGRIELQDVNGSVEAETVNGAIRVAGGSVHKAKIATLNGDIEWEAMPLDQAVISCDTHGGSIVVRSPSDLHASVEADTFNGSIRASGFGLESRNRSGDLSFTVGSGGDPIHFRLSSFNGSIDVEPLE